MDTWKPDTKIVAAAVAGLIAGALQVWLGVDVFPGFEAGLAVVIAYLVPSTATRPITDDDEHGHFDTSGAVSLLVLVILVIVVLRLV